MTSNQVTHLVVGLARSMGSVYGDNHHTPVQSDHLGETLKSHLGRSNGPRASPTPASSSPPTFHVPTELNGIDGFLRYLQLPMEKEN